jgi:hypothetical protein
MNANNTELLLREVMAHHEAMRRQAAQVRLARLSRRQSPRISPPWRAEAARPNVACRLDPAQAPALPE